MIMALLSSSSMVGTVPCMLAAEINPAHDLSDSKASLKSNAKYLMTKDSQPQRQT